MADLYVNWRTPYAPLLKVILVTIVGAVGNELLTRSHIDTHFLDPGQSFFDVDLSDYLVTQSHANRVDRDHYSSSNTPFLLIDVTRMSRSQLAVLLNHLIPACPKVIGLDIYFERQGTSAENDSLRFALGRFNKLVIATRLTKLGESIPNDSALDDIGEKGIINFIAHDSTSVIRFVPTGYLKSGSLPFAAALVAAADSEALADYLSRNHKRERINYDAMLRFEMKPAQEVLATSDTATLNRMVKDKLVLLGNLGANADDRLIHDLHFTPMNSTYVGRSFPDTYGIIIHAYTAAMLLQRTYFTEVPYGLNLFVVILWISLRFRINQWITNRENQKRSVKWSGILSWLFSGSVTILLLYAYQVNYQDFQRVFDSILILKICALSLVANNFIGWVATK